jgi:tetratricopeptide (TPR) repeat protein
MVRRRLNKKVALLGTAFFIIIGLVFIIVMLQFKRSPDEFIKDAKSAIQSARQSEDQKTKEEHYDIAKRKYSSAYSRVTTNAERKEILFDMIDLFIETGDWPYVLDCWDKILLIEPDNIKAQYGRLRYFEILGDSGISDAWKKVHEFASEFLDIAGKKDLMKENVADLQIKELSHDETESKYLGTYLYIMKGQSAFEQVNTGSVTNTEEMLNESENDFELARGFEPNNINVYLNSAKTVLSKGELAASKGSTGDREKAKKQVLDLLEKAAANSTDVIKAQINLLDFKQMLARDNESNQVEGQLKALEPEYLSLQNKYGPNAEVYESISQFYSTYSQNTKLELSRQNLDKAIDAASNALKLDEQNVVYAIQVSDLYHRRYSLYKTQSDLNKTIETAQKALSWPDAQNSSAPGNNIRMRNKYFLNTLLANCFIEQIIEPEKEISEDDKKTLLSEAEKAAHEIQTLIGTGEDPLVLKWQGMLELAKGNTQQAVVKLYKSYEQMKAVKPAKPPWPLDLEFAQLSYVLAKIFMDTDQIGKVYEFLVSAHYSGIAEIKPQARLDYVEVVVQFNRFSDALQNIDAFEEEYGQNERSRKLRILTYIDSDKFEDAEKELGKMQSEDAQTIQLRLALAESGIQQIQMSLTQDEKQDSVNLNTNEASKQTNNQQSISAAKAKEDIKNYTKTAIDLLEKLLKLKPEYVRQSSVINVCRICIANNEIQNAKQLVNDFLTQYPDNFAIKVYQQVLSEPEPSKITQKRYAEIEEKTLSGISDPVKRAVNLGIFYRQNNETQKAIEQLTIALDSAGKIDFTKDESNLDNIKMATGHLFEIALSTSDWDIAEKVLTIVRDKDIDGFKGLFFDARLTAAKGDYKDALTKIDDCIKQRPIFSQLYMFRSSLNAALKNDYAYMEDISKAAYINPLDAAIAKRFAVALYNRNKSLGKEATSAQVTETKEAMEKAIALNRGDLELISLYTEYIASTEPTRAIAIRQDMLAAVPSLDNAMLLGTLAMNVALNAANSGDREGFFDIAGSAFEQARKMDPNDRQVLSYYVRYLQARGKNEQAQKLLEESQDNVLLANNLFHEGDYSEARKVLEKLYSDNPKDSDILRGLMLVAQNLGDKEAVKKYSEELISVDNSLSSLISQIRAFLMVGLTTEVEHKLQSLKEKYPDEPSTILLQAWLVFKQNNPKKALEIINNYLLDNKNNPSAWQLRSEINFAISDFDKAISDLKTSKSLSNDPIISVQLAKIYIQTGRYEEAIKELKDVLENPETSEQAALLLEGLYAQLNRKTALESLYDNILKKYPDNIQWLNKAGSYAMQLKEYERSENFFKKACDIIREKEQGKEVDDPVFFNVFDSFMESLLTGTGDPDRSNWRPEKSQTVLKETEKYINSIYGPLALVRMAQASMNLHNEDKAKEYCNMSLEKIKKDEKYAVEVLLRLYPILGLDEVVKFCNQLLKEKPDSLAANYTMFYLLRLNNDFDKSISYIEKYIELTAKDSPIRNDYIFKKTETLLLAYGYTSDNKYLDKAINDYESLLSEMPNNIKVLNNLAYMLAERNQRLSDAIEYSRRAQELKPNDPGFLDTYSFVLLKNGKISEAEKKIEESLKLYTEQGQMTIPSEVYEHKGMIKEKLDKKEEAYSAYKRALELGSSYLTDKAKDRINQAIERVSP